MVESGVQFQYQTLGLATSQFPCFYSFLNQTGGTYPSISPANNLLSGVLYTGIPTVSGALLTGVSGGYLQIQNATGLNSNAYTFLFSQRGQPNLPVVQPIQLYTSNFTTAGDDWASFGDETLAYNQTNPDSPSSAGWLKVTLGATFPYLAAVGPAFTYAGNIIRVTGQIDIPAGSPISYIGAADAAAFPGTNAYLANGNMGIQAVTPGQVNNFNITFNLFDANAIPQIFACQFNGIIQSPSPGTNFYLKNIYCSATSGVMTPNQNGGVLLSCLENTSVPSGFLIGINNANKLYYFSYDKYNNPQCYTFTKTLGEKNILAVSVRNQAVQFSYLNTNTQLLETQSYSTNNPLVFCNNWYLGNYNNFSNTVAFPFQPYNGYIDGFLALNYNVDQASLQSLCSGFYSYPQVTASYGQSGVTGQVTGYSMVFTSNTGVTGYQNILTGTYTGSSWQPVYTPSGVTGTYYTGTLYPWTNSFLSGNAVSGVVVVQTGITYNSNFTNSIDNWNAGVADVITGNSINYTSPQSNGWLRTYVGATGFGGDPYIYQNFSFPFGTTYNITGSVDIGNILTGCRLLISETASVLNANGVYAGLISSGIAAAPLLLGGQLNSINVTLTGTNNISGGPFLTLISDNSNLLILATGQGFYLKNAQVNYPNTQCRGNEFVLVSQVSATGVTGYGANLFSGSGLYSSYIFNVYQNSGVSGLIASGVTITPLYLPTGVITGYSSGLFIDGNIVKDYGMDSVSFLSNIRNTGDLDIVDYSLAETGYGFNWLNQNATFDNAAALFQVGGIYNPTGINLFLNGQFIWGSGGFQLTGVKVSGYNLSGQYITTGYLVQDNGFALNSDYEFYDIFFSGNKQIFYLTGNNITGWSVPYNDPNQIWFLNGQKIYQGLQYNLFNSGIYNSNFTSTTDGWNTFDNNSQLTYNQNNPDSPISAGWLNANFTGAANSTMYLYKNIVFPTGLTYNITGTIDASLPFVTGIDFLVTETALYQPNGAYTNLLNSGYAAKFSTKSGQLTSFNINLTGYNNTSGGPFFTLLNNNNSVPNISSGQGFYLKNVFVGYQQANSGILLANTGFTGISGVLESIGNCSGLTNTTGLSYDIIQTGKFARGSVICYLNGVREKTTEYKEHTYLDLLSGNTVTPLGVLINGSGYVNPISTIYNNSPLFITSQ